MNMTLCTATLALSLAAWSPLAAQDGGQDANPRPAAAAGQTVDVAAAFDALSAALRSGAPRDEHFDTLRSALETRPGIVAQDPHTRVVTARLQRAVDGLQMRSEAKALTGTHVDMLRGQLVDERIDLALDKLAASIDSGSYSAAELRPILALLDQRAQVCQSFDRKAEELRVRLARELTALGERPADDPLKGAHVEAYRRALVGLRLEHTVDALDALAAAEDLTPHELDVMRGQLEDYAVRAAADSEFAQVREQLTLGLDAIEKQLRNGALDRTELSNLRAHLRTPKPAPAEGEGRG